MAVYPLRPGHPFKELAQTRAWVKHFNMATGLPACSRPGGSLLLSSCVRIAFYLIPKMPLPFVLFMIDFVSLLNFKTKTFKHENVFPWSWGQGGLNLYMLRRIPKKKNYGKWKVWLFGNGRKSLEDRALSQPSSSHLCTHHGPHFLNPSCHHSSWRNSGQGAHEKRNSFFFFFSLEYL